jgi:acetylornithine deacetylase/succinyl-diaminopimelate desuccinylase-like protein
MKNYIEQNRQRFLDELFDFLKIPSISADKAYSESVHKTADFVAEKLKNAGAEDVKIHQTAGYPIVFGQKIIDEKLPTVLVYGHYDVQPADPLDLWTTPPFEPQIRMGKIFARGSSDDKGQMYMHIKALETLLQNKQLNCNLKFMFEGEEEVGSKHLGDFVKAHKDLISADVVLISDTGIISMDCPSITTGLRGLAYMEVEVTGPNRDLHSGMFGGSVANPINILCQMIASLHDEKGRITIPEFYKNVVELSKDERDKLAQAPFSLEQYKKDLDVNDVWGEEGYSSRERFSIRPTLDVNGIWGGYTGEGAKTVLPSKAFAKISMRLVPNQTSTEISELFQRHFESIAPKSVKVVVKPHHGGEPVVTPMDSDFYKSAELAMQEVWGKVPVPTREGGSIPIVALFEKELGLKTILMGFGLDEDAIHSPNESYGVSNYFLGIETICSFFRKVGEIRQK